MSAYALTPLAKADTFNIWCYIAADNEAAAGIYTMLARLLLKLLCVAIPGLT